MCPEQCFIYREDADADRAFIKDGLGLSFAGRGRRLADFRASADRARGAPTEPGKPGHEIYLTSDDIDATVKELEGKGVRVERPFYGEPWGLLAFIRLPGGSKLGIYQPRLPQPTC